MAIEIRGQVGPQVSSDGAFTEPRLGKSGEMVFQELHGRFYEQTYRGSIFSDGMALTPINNVTFTAATLGATATPVIGVYNPATSSVNLVILQAILSIIQTALQATGPGGFVWAMSVGNSAISTGNTPLNRKTLALGGAQGKGMTNVALTGLTNNLVVRFGSVLNGGSSYNASLLATAAGFQTNSPGAVENFDGSLIVPPGGVLALLANGTPVAHSGISAVVWEEVPV